MPLRIHQRRFERHVLLAAVVLAVAIGAAAEDPQPTPAPEATPVPGSLAAAASGLKLQRSTDQGSSLVITDQNLRSTGAGAAISQGTGTATAPATAAAAPAATPAVAGSQANDLGSQLLAQQAKVDELEARLAAMDRALAAPSTDPHYPKTDSAPQFRAPGVVDPAKAERDALAAQLEAERARLDALRAEGEKAGIRLRKVPNDSPPDAPPES